jgi:DNA-nicking Smr family endonuclease
MSRLKDISEKIEFQPFRDLKKRLKRKRREVVSAEASLHKDRPLSDEELFKGSMKDVVEIKEFRELPVYRKDPLSKSIRVVSDGAVHRTLEAIVKGQEPVRLSDTQEYVEWISPDCIPSVAGELHKGRYSVQDTLDLHGAVAEEAERLLDSFIKESLRKGIKCIKIIHGRGLSSPDEPVLKNMVIKLLSRRYRKDIIAFVTARQCDGGLGALYVLLKRR